MGRSLVGRRLCGVPCVFAWYKKNSFPCILFSRYTVMAEQFHFSRVPPEIIGVIVKDLSESDKIALNFAKPGLFIEHK